MATIKLTKALNIALDGYTVQEFAEGDTVTDVPDACARGLIEAGLAKTPVGKKKPKAAEAEA